ANCPPFFLLPPLAGRGHIPRCRARSARDAVRRTPFTGGSLLPFAARHALAIGGALALLLAACAGGAGSSAGASDRTSVDPLEVRRSLSVLAADSMEGRRAGSEGAARAARFIAGELRRYGVEPG